MGIVGLGPATRIGSGGFADVYRAQQTNLRRDVAVKVLRAAAGDAQVRMRFERECHALGAVSGHPNIVAVHEGGFTPDGRAYLVMEYCPRGSLLDQIAARGPLPAAAVSDVGVKIGRALGVAHAARVLHRDVKPANILVTAYGEPALADFGIARVEGGEQTATGLVTASFAHAAPEVLRGRPPTAASDLYSLGSTMYELCSGQPAHFRPDDESAWALMNRVISEPVPDPALVGIPEPLATTIRISTSHAVENRFGSAEELVASLLASTPPTTAPSTTPSPPASPLAARPAEPTPPAAEQLATVSTVPEAERVPVDRRSTAHEPSLVAPPHATAGEGIDGPPSLGEPDQRPRARRRWPIGIAVLAVAAVALGGAGWLVLSAGDSAPEPVRFAFPEGVAGPLDAGTSYDLLVEGGNSATTFAVLVDGQPARTAEGLPIVFTPEAGRYSIAVRATTGELVETTESVEAYVIGAVPSAGYRVNLGSVTAIEANWPLAIERYDELVELGHRELELLPSSRFASLTPGFWNLYVPGFGEDRVAAENYCVSFGLEIPTDCFASRFDPDA